MNRSWMIYYAIALHVVWGTLLLFSEHPANVTAVHSMSFEIHHIVLGILMILVAILAYLGLDCKGNMIGLLLIIPQQLVLMLSAYGAIIAIIQSTFADGVIRPRAFIAADQSPAILAAVLHTFALLDYHFGEHWKWS